MNRNLTEALAILLTQRVYRRKFAENPLDCGRELLLDPKFNSAWTTLCPVALEQQAALLIRKRFHETKKQLPGFLRRKPRLYLKFSEYAESYWPRGHRRHRLDAFWFAWWYLTRPLRFGHDLSLKSPSSTPVNN